MSEKKPKFFISKDLGLVSGSRELSNQIIEDFINFTHLCTPSVNQGKKMECLTKIFLMNKVIEADGEMKKGLNPA